jgi:hypothetical protein
MPSTSTKRTGVDSTPSGSEPQRRTTRSSGGQSAPSNSTHLPISVKSTGSSKKRPVSSAGKSSNAKRHKGYQTPEIRAPDFRKHSIPTIARTTARKRDTFNNGNCIITLQDLSVEVCHALRRATNPKIVS